MNPGRIILRNVLAAGFDPDRRHGDQAGLRSPRRCPLRARSRRAARPGRPAGRRPGGGAHPGAGRRGAGAAKPAESLILIPGGLGERAGSEPVAERLRASLAASRRNRLARPADQRRQLPRHPLAAGPLRHDLHPGREAAPPNRCRDAAGGDLPERRLRGLPRQPARQPQPSLSDLGRQPARPHRRRLSEPPRRASPSSTSTPATSRASVHSTGAMARGGLRDLRQRRQRHPLPGRKDAGRRRRRRLAHRVDGRRLAGDARAGRRSGGAGGRGAGRLRGSDPPRLHVARPAARPAARRPLQRRLRVRSRCGRRRRLRAGRAFDRDLRPARRAVSAASVSMPSWPRATLWTSRRSPTTRRSRRRPSWCHRRRGRRRPGRLCAVDRRSRHPASGRRRPAAPSPTPWRHGSAGSGTETDKAWVAVVDAGPLYDPFANRLEELGIPTFRSADRALRLLDRYSRHRAVVGQLAAG